MENVKLKMVMFVVVIFHFPFSIFNSYAESLVVPIDPSVSSTRTTCDFTITYNDLADFSALPVEPDACRFTLARREDGKASFVFAAGEVWHFVGTSALNPATGVPYDLRVETIVMGEKKYASLSVRADGEFVRLEDEYGAKWFAFVTEKTAFTELEFKGEGTVSAYSAGENANEPIAVRDWVGGEKGNWTDAANWAGEAGTPAAGEVVRIAGSAALSGNGEAAVRDLVARVGEGGALEMLAGAFETPIEFDVTRPRVGKKLSVEVGSFGGLSRPLDSIAWYRGSPQKVYEAEPVGEAAVYTPTKDDYEHWFRVVATRQGEAVLDQAFFFSPLPVLYMTTKDGQTPSEKKEKHDGTLFVQGNGDFKSTYDGEMEIKVRGNTTKTLPKKPWKLKLTKKAEMCGFAKSKHWVLLANYYDESSMRNKLAYDFANEIGSLGMKSDWVECVLNGEWQGLYQLCEHIRIDKNRVNIFNWEDEAEARGIDGGDEDFSWVTDADDISGGYLIESSEEMDELSNFAIRPRDDFIFNIMVNSPEYLYTSDLMMNYLRGYFGGFYEAMIAPDGYSSAGLALDEYADIDSMAAYFLVMEMFGNNDAEKKSRYFYKDRGEKVRFGPVWDFDWGVGNITLVGAHPEGWKACGHVCSLFRQWADDPWFVTRLETLYWSVARPKFVEILGEKGLVAGYKTLLAIPGAANDAKWGYHRGFNSDADALGDYLASRLVWLDKQFKDVPTLMASLKVGSWAVPVGNTPGSYSATPYTPDSSALPIVFANLAPSGRLAPGRGLRLSVNVGAGIAEVGVYANGRKVGGRVAVAGGKVEATIPARMLTVAKGEANCVSLVAYDGAGTVVARNFANVAVSSPLVMLLK